MSKDSEEMNEMLTDVVLAPLVKQLRSAALAKIDEEFRILDNKIKTTILQSGYAKLLSQTKRFSIADYIDIRVGKRPTAPREAVESYVMQAVYKIAETKLNEVLYDQKGVYIPREETKGSDSKKDK